VTDPSYAILEQPPSTGPFSGVMILRGWWHAATLFIYFYINRADIQHVLCIPLLLNSLLSAW
jgi:hypothetical protein